MTLSQRSLLAFGSVLALVGMTYLYVIVSMTALAGRAQEVDRLTRAVAAASRADAETLQGSLRLEQFITSGDATKLQALYVHRAAGAEARRRLRELTRRDDVMVRLDGYDKLLPARVAAADRIVEAVTAGASLAQVLEIRKERDRLDEEALRYPREIIEIELRAIGDTLATTSAYRRTVIFNVIVMASVTLLATLAISLWTSRGLVRRLAPLTGMATRVAHGDFTARVPQTGSDEVAVLADAFNKMAGELQQIDKTKDEFVALASHQLRTPASAVKGNISMLLDGYFGTVPAEQQEILEDAYASNERQLGIIDDMLSVARVELGRLVVTKASTNMAQLVEAAVDEHRFAIQSRDQTVEVVRPEQLEYPVDAPKMKIVLDNLISNASKYTPAGGRIRVRLEARPGGILIDVQDNGVGIPEQGRDQLFRKFSRITNPLSAESGGTGLGLYLANEIVKLHGGDIQVTSSESMGSTFSVSLPTG